MTKIHRPEPQNRFYQAVQKLGTIDESSLYDLFDLIQAPGSLQAFFVHIPLLPDVFSTAIELTDIYGVDDDRYQQAEKTARQLKSLLPDMESNPGLRDLRKPVPLPQHGPCDGILQSHPLYSLLAENVPHKDFYKSFVCLKSQILLAVDGLDLSGQQVPELLESFRCARNLAENNNRQYLGLLPNQAVAAETLLGIVRSKFPPRLKPVGKLLEIGEKGFSKRKPRKNTFPRFWHHLPIGGREDDEEPANDYMPDIEPSTTLTAEESEAYTSFGGLPGELGGDIDLEPVLSDDKYHGPTRRQLAFQAKQSSNHRAMLNQFSGMAWNQANLHDLKVLFEFLAGENELNGFAFQPLTKEEAAFLLGLAFFTCAPVARVLALPVFEGCQPIMAAPEGLYRIDNRMMVRLFSPGPELSGSGRPRRIPGAFEVDVFSNIPLPGFLSDFMGKEDRAGASGPVRRHLFSAANPKDGECVQEVLAQLRGILSALNSSSGARLSLGRITSYLLFRVAEAEKCDLPSSMLYWGRNDTIARTRIHYTVAAIGNLETAYRNQVNNLFDKVGHGERFSLDESVNAGGYLGTPLCPLPKTVRDLSRDLQSAVRSSAKLSLAERHNRYALYTSMLINFGTGYRSINDPSLKEMEIDFDLGVGIIADKGIATYRSRYVYLAPVVLKQIRYYRQHMQVIYSKLGVDSPPIFDLVKNRDYEGLPLNLFWMGGDLEPVQLLGPEVVKERLKKDYGYHIPQYSGRHYLKYRLLQRGCSPEIIEAQLGHWENGQEPWGRFSNLDPLDFIEEMSAHLPKIMEEDGWKDIQGLN